MPKNTPKTAADLATEIETADKNLAALRQQRAELEAEIPAAERAGAEAIGALDGRIIHARREERHGERMLADLRHAHQTLVEKEQAQRWRERRKIAGAKCATAIEAVISAQAKVMEIMGPAMADLEQASKAVAAVNADAPDGAEPLADPSKDPRLVAGFVREREGLFVKTTTIDWRDARWWARLSPIMTPPDKPATQVAPRAATIADLAREERQPDPNAGRGKGMAAFHRPNASPQPARTDETTFLPGTFHSVGGSANNRV